MHKRLHQEKSQKAEKPIPPENNPENNALHESLMTVPEIPSPDQPSDGNFAVKKELGHSVEVGARKWHCRLIGNGRNPDQIRGQNGGGFSPGNGDTGTRSGSAYSEICSSAAEHFAQIREVLVERSVTSTLNSGFLTPCQELLVVALGLDLFAVNDEKFMDMFVAPGAIDSLKDEKQSLRKRQKILHSCLNEFKSVTRALR